MKHLKTYKIFESVDRKFVSDFLLDFGFLISMKFSQITKMGIDEEATKELTSMMKRLREPLINGKTYFELIDNVNDLYKSPKLLSAFIGQIRELLIYIEPRIKNYVKDCDVKDNWLGKIDKFKERYKQIVS
ncbi:MAG: hypothetical protein K9G65_00525 [Rickettsiaceae bacterium]|nr:hypothetical protein [Rickettsiaceae bacterium]